MLLAGKQLQIIVFQVDNDNFEQLGMVNQFTSFIWPTIFRGYGQFTLKCPVNEETKELMKEGRVLWCDGGTQAGIIEIVSAEIDDDGVFSYEIKGFTLEYLLTTRIVWGTYDAVNIPVSTAIMQIVSQAMISPSDSNRKLNYLQLGADSKIGGKITKQQTGSEVYDVIDEMASDADLGFDIDFDPVENIMTFEVTQGTDRSINQTTNDTVVLSTDMEDILTSVYEIDIQDEKSIAFVQGEGEGAERKSTTSGDATKVGYDRKELYVDARDLQSESSSGTTLTEEQYIQALQQRGLEKLSNYVKSESFEVTLRVFGETQYDFGTDYFVGDKITVQDKRIGVQADAVISAAEETYERTYSLSLTVGFSNLTILQKIKRGSLD